MDTRTIDNERLEAVAFCRKFRRLCIDKKLYINGKVKRNDYCKLMGTNHVYMCKRIKLGSGFTLNHFVLAIRLNIAYKLLKSTNNNMTLVITKSGFADKSSFYRAFRKRFKTSPTALRNKYFANR